MNLLKNTIGALACIMLICVSSADLYAGTTGKIAGRITDANTGEPLVGANVIIIGTTLGAATDLEGYFNILRVPPGVYSVEVSYIGYSKMTYQDVKVSVDLTTKLDAALRTEAFTGEEVIVIAEEPAIVKDLTATTARVDAEEIAQLPVTEVTEILDLQAGYVDGHVRGGRSGELAYWIDGIPVTDTYDGSTVVEVNKDMVQELQLVSGAFNAEYGRAMSGVVNIVTKTGAEKLSGSVTTYAGDFLSNNDDIFPNIGDFNPGAIQNIDASLSGPIWKDKISFFANARLVNFDGHIYGKRRFTPWNVAGFDNQGDFLLHFFPTGNDSLNIQPGVGDNKYVPMNWNEKRYFQGKLSFKLSEGMQLSVNGILDDVDYQSWSIFDGGLMAARNYKYNPDGAPLQFRTGYTTIGKFTHTLSSNTFYEIGVSFFNKQYKRYLYENPNDTRYIPRDIGSFLLIQQPYSYMTGGTYYGRFTRETKTLLTKIDLTSQITRNHQIKAGFEFRRTSAFLENFDPPMEAIGQDVSGLDLRELYYYQRYDHRPIELSGYIQDKMEFGELIINAGIRLDYFRPDGQILADPTDPNIFNPIKPENRYNDLNGNGVQDADEPDVTFAERESYWYKDATSKLQFSPRIGAAFPITDRGVFHFSYGHFFQIPSFERLYQNPNFVIGSGTGNQGLVGNADMEPEKTVSAEVGLQQQLTDDITVNITGYFRDVRDLTGTRADEIVVYGGFAGYSRLVNSDFGFIRGLVISMNKRFSGGFSSTFDYTYQVAKGSNSDPEAARNAVLGGALPEVQLTPLGWDQRHTVNATVSYNQATWGGSFIMQYGSGTPYTPRRLEDISSLLTNSQIKPSRLTIDFRGYREVDIYNYKLNFFVRVFNLLDALNEVNVFNDTGRAGFTTDLLRARQQNWPEYINTLEDWFTNPLHYSEPRRVEFGMTVSF